MSRLPQRDAPGRAATDPLRLCVFTTVALLTWVVGPAVVALFAGFGFAGYLRAHRAGHTSSRCVLRDTRLVLAYLGVVGLVAAGFLGRQVSGLLG